MTKKANYNLEHLRVKLLKPYLILTSICYILLLIPSITSVIIIKNTAYTIVIILIILVNTISPIIYLFYVIHHLSPLEKIDNYIKQLSAFNYYKKKEYTDTLEYRNILDSIYNLSQLLEETKLNYERYKSRINEYNANKLNIELQEKDLIYSISHELKTPISIIEAGTYAILDGIYQGEEEKEQLKTILHQCELSISMIQDVLNVFKLSRKDFKTNDSKFDLKQLVETKLNSFDHLFKKYNHNLIVNLDKTFIYADSKQIDTVLSNVIQNAIVNSSLNSTIKVSLKKMGKESIFEIINTNAFIPEDKLEHIFEPFVKMDESHTKKEYKGNGLGLYIVKQILNRYNYDFGIVNVENGVKFYFIGNENLLKK